MGLVARIFHNKPNTAIRAIVVRIAKIRKIDISQLGLEKHRIVVVHIELYSPVSSHLPLMMLNWTHRSIRHIPQQITSFRPLPLKQPRSIRPELQRNNLRGLRLTRINRIIRLRLLQRIVPAVQVIRIRAGLRRRRLRAIRVFVEDGGFDLVMAVGGPADLVGPEPDGVRGVTGGFDDGVGTLADGESEDVGLVGLDGDEVAFGVCISMLLRGSATPEIERGRTHFAMTVNLWPSSVIFSTAAAEGLMNRMRCFFPDWKLKDANGALGSQGSDVSSQSKRFLPLIKLLSDRGI